MSRLCVSIVVYNTNEQQLTRSLSDLTHSVEYAIADGTVTACDIHIIDNNSVSKSAEVVVSKHESDSTVAVHYTRNSTNKGFGQAHNQVCSESEFRMILNPDAYLDVSYVNTAIQYLAGHSGCAAVTPIGKDQADNDLYLAKRYPTLQVLFIRALGSYYPSLLNHPANEYYCYFDTRTDGPHPIEHASGCCMLFRSSDFQAIDGFDSRFFLYFEDFDLSISLARRGEITCLPDLKLIHDGGHTARKSLKTQLNFMVSAFRFYSKHGWRFL